MNKNEIDELKNASKSVIEAINSFQQPAKNSNAATITVNAGGVGVWASTTAALVMLALNILLGVLLITDRLSDQTIVASQERKIDRMQEHLNAIYMMAPHLKPEDKKP